MDKDRQTEPWMPPIQNLAKAGPVGVIKLRCTTTFEHIGHWIRMRQSLARYSAPVSSVHAPSWADFITTMVGFRVFGTHRNAFALRIAATETTPERAYHGDP